VKAKRNQAGFPLLEMIMVIVIMAMVAGLVLVKQPWHSAGLNTDATVRALTNGLQLARSSAIAQDRMVSVVTAAEGFSVDGGAAWPAARRNTHWIAGSVHAGRRINWRDDPARGWSQARRGGCELADRTRPVAGCSAELN
jgi:prepilin-type N-terminal cleavage/methylation domain-containing protein